MRSYVRYGSGAALVLGLFASPVLAQSDSADINARLDEMEDRIDMIDELTDSLQAGTDRFVLSGYAFAGFSDPKGGNSSFDARFFPIFQWRLGDDLFAAAELEVELAQANTGSTTGSSDGTAVVLEFLELDYIINDWLTFRAGKMLSPLSTFKEQLHPAWINKLPDQPLFATGGARLIPTSNLGIEVRGAVPVSNDSKLTYSLWITNGPKLVTNGSGSTGQLNFKNFTDVNDNKAFGARIGFFPIPELEIAYAIWTGEVGASGTAFSGLDMTIHDISLGYVVEDESLGGQFNIQLEYVTSEVDATAFGVNPTFANEREGGYAQVSYRPTMASGNIKNLEFVARYDYLENPSTATIGRAYDENRWTIGANYWLSPSAVLKFAYRFDDVNDPTSVTNTGTDAFMAQFTFGF